MVMRASSTSRIIGASGSVGGVHHGEEAEGDGGVFGEPALAFVCDIRDATRDVRRRGPEPYPLEWPEMSYEGIITVEPGKRGGQPCIRGMRITVYDVLSYLASGMTEDEVLADFPYLTREDILACLSYAAEREHRMLVANE